MVDVKTEELLSGIRVIDVATARGELAGRVLADLGAEVVKVEPPGGAEARRRPPFVLGKEGDPDASLYWASVALGKRSLVLDLEAPADAARLQELVAGADVFIESSEPGRMEAAGYGYPRLSAANPGLVYASITPFGQDGPLARAPAADLTVEAAGGLLGLQGDGDRPPLACGFPQASFHAAAQAAADIVTALHERDRSGLGQYIDVSAQAAVVGTLMNAVGYPALTRHDPPGTGEARAAPPDMLPGLPLPRRVAVADGYSQIALPLPGLGERTLHALLAWAQRSGSLPQELCDRDWSHFIGDFFAGKLERELLLRAVDAGCQFLSKKTKREIMDFAVRHRVLLGPVYTVEDLLRDPQLSERDYWVEIDGRTHPGAYAKLSETPLCITRGAPALGEAQDLAATSAPAVSTPARGARGGAFEGLRVADFSWAAAGPIMARALADQGATVVHVESSAALDVTRTAPPFLDDEADIDRAHMVANFNASKLGVTLDLTTAGGRTLGRRLSDWADVVIESFTPGNMEKFGLDWATLSAERDDLLMLSTSLRGQTGPERRYPGYGSQGAALSGIESVTGWPDRPPAGPWGAYTDFITPRYGIAILAAALRQRARTGQGQFIDLSQVEAGIHFVEPLVLDYTVNGRVAAPEGHASPYACPHGVYPAAGRERYVAIAVETPAQWRALCQRAPLDAFGGEAFTELTSRADRRAEIDGCLTAWCRELDAFSIAEDLRVAGVPAYAVLRPMDLYGDPQLAHRGFFVDLEHPVLGTVRCDGAVSRFSATPARPLRAGPILGEHTQQVLRDLLGYSDEEIFAFAAEGALS